MCSPCITLSSCMLTQNSCSLRGIKISPNCQLRGIVPRVSVGANENTTTAEIARIEKSRLNVIPERAPGTYQNWDPKLVTNCIRPRCVFAAFSAHGSLAVDVRSLPIGAFMGGHLDIDLREVQSPSLAICPWRFCPCCQCALGCNP